MSKRKPKVAGRKRWIEGLDWMRVDTILEHLDDDNPEFGERVYTILLKNMMQYLPDMGEGRAEKLSAEALRRAEAGEMSEVQLACYVEALRQSNEETDKLIAAMEKVLKRSRLRVVK
jgi:hypothetical protein